MQNMNINIWRRNAKHAKHVDKVIARTGSYTSPKAHLALKKMEDEYAAYLAERKERYARDGITD